MFWNITMVWEGKANPRSPADEDQGPLRVLYWALGDLILMEEEEKLNPLIRAKANLFIFK